jgi:hypothetical protein
MGAVEEIHNRECELALRLARGIVEHLHEREGAMVIDSPAEREWGEVTFRVRVRHAPITVTLKIDP